MHGAILREARVFGVLNNGEIDLSRSAQRVAHGGFIQDRLAIVSDRNCAGALQGAKIRKHGPLAGLRCGSHGKHVHHGAALRLPHPCDPLRRIEHRCGIWHAAHGCESPGCRRSRS